MTSNIASTLAIKISEISSSYYIEATGINILVRPVAFKLSLSDEELETIDLLHAEPIKVSENLLISLGQSLYKAVFIPEILLAYDKLKRKMNGSDGIRIRLIINVSSFSGIPWEVMHDGKDFISLYSEYPLVRGMSDTYQVRQTPVNGPIRILYAWSEPEDLPKLYLDDTAEKIKKLLEKNKHIKFDILPNATLLLLRRSLLSQYHVICFAGHGTEKDIYLENKQVSEKLSAKELARELEGRPVQLIFLAACKTAAKPSEGLAGFAQTLASETRIPAIVAMQYEISDEQANILAARYFEILASFRPIDVALADARKALLKEHHILRDVFAPIVYLQSQTSNLFRRARNWIAISLAFVLVVTAIISLFLWQNLGIAETNRYALGLSNNAERVLAEGNRDLALSLAMDAYTANPESREVQNILTKIILDTNTLMRVNLKYQPANSIAVSNDGNYALIGSGTYIGVDVGGIPGGGLILLDLKTRKTHQFDIPLVRNGGDNTAADNWMIYSVAISPDGRRALSGSANGAIMEWDIPSGKFVRYYDTSEFDNIFNDYAFLGAYVTRIEYSKNGEHVLTHVQFGNNYVILWDTKTGQMLETLSITNFVTNDGSRYDLSYIGGVFNMDGTGVLLFKDNRLVLWDIQQKKIVKEYPNLEQGQYYENQQGIYIIAEKLNSNQTILIDASTGNEVRMFPFSAKGVIRPLHNEFLTNDLILYSLDSGSEITRYKGHISQINKVVFAPDGDTFFSGSGNSFTTIDNSVRWWKVNSTGQLKTYSGEYDNATQLLISPSGKYLFLGLENGVINVIERKGGSIIHSLTGGHLSEITAIAINTDETLLISGSNDDNLLEETSKNMLVLWDIQTGELIRRFAWEEGYGDTVSAIAFVPNTNQAITGGSYSLFSCRCLQLWDISRGDILHTFEPVAGTNDLAVSPDGQSILTGEGILGREFYFVDLWDIASGARRETGEHGNRVYAVAFSNDGKLGFSGSGDGLGNDYSIKIWDINSWGNSGTMVGHSDPIVGITVCPDNATLISLSQKNEMILWDLQNKVELRRLNAKGKRPTISPDCKYYITSSQGGTLAEWIIPYSIQSFFEWAQNNLYIKEFNCEERLTYSIKPLCEDQ